MGEKKKFTFASMKDLEEINIWKTQLGLLPISLNPSNLQDGFMMMNGGNGDFCLKFSDSGNQDFDYFSTSWSSSTKNFISVTDENVNIHNWFNEKTEKVSKKIVSENLSKFYKYLLSKNHTSSKDLVPFIIDIFRQFRNLSFEKSNPVYALNMLFGLLTSLEDDINNLNYEKWGLQQIEFPDGFDFYLEKLKNVNTNLKPRLDLILRHSSGILFQEAQKEVLFFNPQRDLFGGISNSLKTKRSLYSSIHYTPPFLSRTIVENTLKFTNLKSKKLKIFDPACGSSEFLIEVLKQLAELNYKGNIEVIGWDISETAINTSKFLLSYEKRTFWKNNLDFKLKLVEDSLNENWDNDYDIILMNPPFTSWELLDSKNKRDSVKESLGDSFIGKKPNQASAFIYKAINHLNNEGIIGSVIPSSILTLDSYSKLRAEIFEKINIEILAKLGNFTFEDALTDVSFLIAKKPNTLQSPIIIWTRNEKGIAQEALREFRKSIYNNQFTVDNHDFSIFQPLLFPILKENWKPISYKNHSELKNIERFVIEKKLFRISEIFNVKQGIRTGNNKVFKLSINEFNELPNIEKKYFRPSIENDSIINNRLEITNYVWYPYNDEGIIIKNETEFKSKVPSFYRKICNSKRILANRARKDESNWWYLSEHRAWLRIAQKKLVSTEFGRSTSFAFDIKGDFLVERGNAWIPKKEFNENDYYFYLSVFTSSFFDKLLSIYSKELLSGWDLGNKYTSNIPIPNVHLQEVKNSEGYHRLVEIGKQILEGNAYTKTMSDNILERYFYPNS